MSNSKEGNLFKLKIKSLFFRNKINLGWLKIKLQNQIKWHRRYCIIDWDKAVLFIASRADTRYRDWIKLLPNVLINDYDYLSNNESNNNHSLINTIEIKANSMKSKK
jgi:hypothetical protein